MSNDKTLADAKPGGYVQLPASERERFEAWAYGSGRSTARFNDGGYCDERTVSAWLAWQAALAAQPSPTMESMGKRKLHQLQGDGYIVNGVAIFNPETGRRGLVDNLGYVGWVAQPSRGEMANPISPSPGGQGDVGMRALAASIGEVAHRLSTYMPHLSEWADRARDCKKAADVLAALAARPPVTDVPECAKLAMYDEVWNALHAAGFGDELASSIAAMAARQPAGEAIGEIIYSGEGGLQIEFYDGKPLAPMKLYAAPTAQQPAQVYLDGLDRALGEAIDQRDRYHEMADDLAGHIAAITGVDIGEHSSANCPWQNAIEAAEEYKPAQAVDLGQQQDAARYHWLRDQYDPSVHDDEDRSFLAMSGEELDAAIDDLIAGKAVGNG